jgi:hypothetical protein
MTTAEAAALLAAGAFLALTVVLSIVCGWAVVRMRRETESLRTSRVETEALIAELGAAVAQAHAAATRLDGSARRAGAGSTLAYETFSAPVVKGLALASGIGQAARSMRSK